jgi:hypothetical protein
MAVAEDWAMRRIVNNRAVGGLACVFRGCA